MGFLSVEGKVYGGGVGLGGGARLFIERLDSSTDYEPGVECGQDDQAPV